MQPISHLLIKLEQLEHLRSKIPPPPHDYPYWWFTSESKSKQTKSKFQILINCQKFIFFCNRAKTLHATHLLKLLDKMYKYEMDPTRIVGATERTPDAGRTDGRADGRTDGRTDGVKPIYPQQLRCRYNEIEPNRGDRCQCIKRHYVWAKSHLDMFLMSKVLNTASCTFVITLELNCW